jgi:hypothetical protein
MLAVHFLNHVFRNEIRGWAAFDAAAKKSTDKCKSEDEASPNEYTRMLAPICGPRPFLPTTRLVCK